jgi:hypothetical protein
MSCYLRREDAVHALKKMRAFYKDLYGLYKTHNFDLQANLGRRNMLMSQPQEAHFADVLKHKFPLTVNNGATGEPDIYIPELAQELECKLTSRNKSGSISFQSDYETLQKKGKLDYLYVIASESFDEFFVVLYKDLTIDDFRKLSPGARGRVQLKKYAAQDRATVLFGNLRDLSKENKAKINRKLSGKLTENQRNKLEKSLHFWNNSSNRYAFELESIREAG